MALIPEDKMVKQITKEKIKIKSLCTDFSSEFSFLFQKKKENE